MNGSNPLYIALTVLIIAFIACFAVFRPNTVRWFFGFDWPFGSYAEVQVERAKLKARAKDLQKEMDGKEEQRKKLDKDIEFFKGTFNKVMRHRRVRGTEYPTLWEEALNRPTLEKLSEFQELKTQVGNARDDLAAGGNPTQWEKILNEARSKTDEIDNNTKKRTEAWLKIKEIFVKTRP